MTHHYVPRFHPLKILFFEDDSRMSSRDPQRRRFSPQNVLFMVFDSCLACTQSGVLWLVPFAEVGRCSKPFPFGQCLLASRDLGTGVLWTENYFSHLVNIKEENVLWLANHRHLHQTVCHSQNELSLARYQHPV